MRRRALLGALGASIAAPLARAQQRQASGKIPRVGILSAADSEATPIFDAFRRGLRKRGYLEGGNIMLEYRLARGDFGRLRGLSMSW